ncbi:MAG: FAD-dependent oxidoreductase [Deltaproteobacteria bacterium]|nr:FAD-dependent oxidoreductase [Deltaproteobacteria bacterium]
MIFIVGGGVVGLHVAIALASRPGHPEIFVLEKTQFLGDHTSGRNSQVIHAGFAYPIGSLKAALCLEGNRLSYEWLRRLQVPHLECGKWIVAFAEDELPALGKVLEIGAACGVPGMRETSPAEIAKAEPSAHPFAGAVFSATSGMMDAAEYIRALERYVVAQENCYLLYPCEVTGIDPIKRVITTSRGEMSYDLLINAAGLWADEVYRLCGGTRAFRIKPFKGEYYVWKTGKIRSVIYPVPRRYLPGREHDKRLVSSMGIHLHRDTGGQLFVGPTQVELDWDRKTDYSFATPREEFVRHAARYAPVDDPTAFEQAYAGNRPKLYEDGKPLGDYQIFRDGAHIHLLGIESPGLTAAPAIGKLVAGMVAG